MAKFVKLDQKKNQVSIKEMQIAHPLVYNYFNSQPDEERDELLTRALAIGVLALMEDRLSAFLAKTSNTLGTELEQLKYLFDLNQQLFLKTTGKGRDAEVDIVSILTQFIRERGYPDEVEHAGDNFGKLPKNKSGDILIDVKGARPGRIVVESKFDKGKRLGLIAEKDIFSRSDTAVGQLLEALANREANAAIIVFDRAAIDGKLLDEVGSVRYVPGCGFVCVVDSARGDYTNLLLSYEIVRSAHTREKPLEPQAQAVLALIVGRFLHDFSLFTLIKKRVREGVEHQIELLELCDQALLSIEFTKEIFGRFLETGELSREELHNFYQAPEVKERYQGIEKELAKLFPQGGKTNVGKAPKEVDNAKER
jgi:hypothetical protein